MTMHEDEITAEALTEEMESMLDALGRAKDADVVKVLITSDSTVLASADRVAGIPGVGTTAVLGVVVRWFFALVQKFLEKGSEKGGEHAAEWIARRLGKQKPGEYTVSDRLETLAKITHSLEADGWPKDLVKKTADELWARGEKVAQRLATEPRR